MKVSREQARQNRDNVVEAAARLFREHGVQGIGVADLMKSVGLSHGGFYGQFHSKEELVAEACTVAFDRAVEKWKRTAAAHPDHAARAIADFYLSPDHRDHPGGGCVAAALAADMPRQGATARRAFTQGVCDLVDVMANEREERMAKTRRRKALATFSAMLGAIVLARAVDDPELSDEILRAVREDV